MGKYLNQNKLMSAYSLSEKQSKAILDMRLQKLTSLESAKIKEEYEELLRFIARCKEILESKDMDIKCLEDIY